MMNKLFTYTISIFAVFSCSTDQKPEAEETEITPFRADTIPPTAAVNEKPEIPPIKVFAEVANFPSITDTSEFINELVDAFQLNVHESPVQKDTDEITTYKKVKIYGCDKYYYLIEYDWKVGSMADYPWKHQVLVSPEGKHVATFEAYRFDFITVFPGENPFLLIVKVSSRGNGGHELYKISSDTVENVYEGYYNYAVQTYAAHEHMSVFRPNELRISIRDENKDGFNDIIFSGENLMLGKYTPDSFWYDVEGGIPFTVSNPASIEQIRYVFLYDKQTGHFKAKEEYRRWRGK